MKKYVRLYDEDGNHVLSILPCVACDSNIIYDITTPDGKVLWWGRVSESDTLQVIIDNLPEVQTNTNKD